MSKLTLRTLKRKNLAYGKFGFEVLLNREAKQTRYSDSNAAMVESMRDMLRTTCVGEYRLNHIKNTQGKRVYTKLFLTNAMDLAMIKLVHHDKLFKIYKIKIPDTAE
jgi:hypothetical protein